MFQLFCEMVMISNVQLFFLEELKIYVSHYTTTTTANSKGEGKSYHSIKEVNLKCQV